MGDSLSTQGGGQNAQKTRNWMAETAHPLMGIMAKNSIRSRILTI